MPSLIGVELVGGPGDGVVLTLKTQDLLHRRGLVFCAVSLPHRGDTKAMHCLGELDLNTIKAATRYPAYYMGWVADLTADLEARNEPEDEEPTGC